MGLSPAASVETGAGGAVSAAGAGGGLAAALRVSSEVEQAVIVHVVCDRGDRYLSTGVFPT